MSDANRKRTSEVFAKIYCSLSERYRRFLSDSSRLSLPVRHLKIVDSTTISLFSDILKGVGRNPVNGKKKGGIKMHTMIKALEDVPCLIRFTKAAAHDHTFLKELDLEKGSFVVFDKAYNDYRQYLQWTEDDIYFVTRQKDNAVYTGIEEFDLSDNASDTVLKDERIGVEKDGKVIELRRVAYWDADKGKVFGFISNNFLIAPDKIAAIYKHRWQIETMFKRLKLPPEILPRGQSKCNRDTDMVRSDRSIANAGGTTQNKAKIGLFKHGINGKVPSDDIHRPVQVP